MHIIHILFGKIHIKYNSLLVSKVLINSLENKNEGIKTHRLNGLSVSLREAENKVTKGGRQSIKRIVIGLNDNNDLYLLDGRHLLEAYRILKKDIPRDVICFVSQYVKKVFTKSIKSLDS